MRFERQTFTTNVTLDYNEFIDCTIKDCTVLYFGGDFSLTRTTLSNVRFGLGESANRTLDFLRLVRANGQQLLDELLDAAPGPAPDSVTINQAQRSEMAAGPMEVLVAQNCANCSSSSGLAMK